jgi:hypothetical protein
MKTRNGAVCMYRKGDNEVEAIMCEKYRRPRVDAELLSHVKKGGEKEASPATEEM